MEYEAKTVAQRSSKKRENNTRRDDWGGDDWGGELWKRRPAPSQFDRILAWHINLLTAQGRCCRPLSTSSTVLRPRRSLGTWRPAMAKLRTDAGNNIASCTHLRYF